VNGINSHSQNQSSLSFADKLFDQTEYYRAITEYERALYFDCKNINDSIYCYYQIIKSYYRGKEFDNAVSFIRSNRSQIDKNLEIATKLNYYTGICYLKLEMPSFSLYYFEKDSSYAKSKLFSGISHLYLHNWECAQTKFLSVLNSDDTEVAKIAGIMLEYCNGGRKTGRKNPYLAGSLSIIPGLGYLYTKHYQSALSAFTLNLLLFGSSYEFQYRGYKVVSITALAFAIAWYIGNIFGSVSSANRLNEKSEKEFIEGILGKFPALIDL
jgi:tetratricopeptide (TPR) repeat protein